MKIYFLPALMLAWLPLPVAAHIHLAPETVSRGTPVEIALVVGHGCKGTPTTALRVAIPPALTAVSVPQKAGWTVTTTPGEIRWDGGPLPDGEKASFPLRATLAPDAPGAVAIPVIQVCGGLETRWIETGAGAESPAPVLKTTPAK